MSDLLDSVMGSWYNWGNSMAAVQATKQTILQSVKR